MGHYRECIEFVCEVDSMPNCICEYVRDAHAAIERVEALHAFSGICPTCKVEGPCPTMIAIHGKSYL